MSEITASGCLFYAKSTKRFLFLNRQLKQKGPQLILFYDSDNTQEKF